MRIGLGLLLRVRVCSGGAPSGPASPLGAPSQSELRGESQSAEEAREPVSGSVCLGRGHFDQCLGTSLAVAELGPRTSLGHAWRRWLTQRSQGRGRPTGCPATASAARARRLQSQRCHATTFDHPGTAAMRLTSLSNVDSTCTSSHTTRCCSSREGGAVRVRVRVRVRVNLTLTLT